jgi:hypothetical protein
MICRNGHYVSDSFVACPTCTKAAWEKGVAEYQHEFLRRAVAGLAQLKILKAEPKHLLLFGADMKTTFCGVELKAKPMPRFLNYAPYSIKTLATVCPSCRTALSRAVEEAGKA